jgi:hypothetical protein
MSSVARLAVVAAAAFAVAGLLPAAPAQADPPPWAPAHGWHKKHHKHRHGDDVVVIRRSPEVVVVERAPRVVYVEPPPPAVVYRPAPPPVAYYQPAPPPAYYQPPPQVACGGLSHEMIAGLVGAAGGGFAGSHIGKGDGRLAATGAGVLGGALLGGSVGRSLDRANGC